MSDLEHWQTVGQWQEYQELILNASTSRSDAIQLLAEINKALKEKENEQIHRSISTNDCV